MEIIVPIKKNSSSETDLPRPCPTLRSAAWWLGASPARLSPPRECNEAPTGWLAPAKWSGGDLGFPPLNAKANNSPFHPLGDALRTQSQGLITLSLHIQWHSGLSPQEVTKRKGKRCRGPSPGEPLPHSCHRKRERTGKTNQRAGDLPSSGVLSKHPFLPVPSLSQSPWILDPEGVLSINFLGGLLDTILCRDSLSLQAQEKQERAGLLANSPRWGPGGKRTHRCFRGLLSGCILRLGTPLPGPNHKQKQPSSQLTCRFSQEMGGLCDPESGMHTYNNTCRPETLRHTGTNHTQARCPHHSLTTRSIFSQAPDVSTEC